MNNSWNDNSHISFLYRVCLVIQWISDLFSFEKCRCTLIMRKETICIICIISPHALYTIPIPNYEITKAYCFGQDCEITRLQHLTYPKEDRNWRDYEITRLQHLTYPKEDLNWQNYEIMRLQHLTYPKEDLNWRNYEITRLQHLTFPMEDLNWRNYEIMKAYCFGQDYVILRLQHLTYPNKDFNWPDYEITRLRDYNT